MLELNLRKHLRVLVVEDDEVNRRVTARMLESRGYEVETAADGQKALAHLGNADFDVVLMDISMPRIDGIALTRQMKKYSRTRDIPVIAMSAYAAPEARERFMNQGMDEYMPKPLDPEKLSRLILKLTARSNEFVDGEGLMLRTGGDREFLQEIADLFCQSAGEIIKEISTETDEYLISELAHKLKGSAGTAGARTVSELAVRIKDAADQGDLEEVRNICQEFNQALRLYREGLAEYGIFLHGN